jgi:hypothetical protein
MQQKSPVTQTIFFPNGNRALAITVSLGTPAGDIVGALGIEQPQALILLSGGAAGLDETLKSRSYQLLSRGVVPAAVSAGVMVFDGGTRSGIMEQMGNAVADCENKIVQLGVAPSAKVAYPDESQEKAVESIAPLDPNHTHFVLVDCKEWGCETKTMFELAKYLGKGIPVVTVLFNGGEIAKEEVRQSVRQHWPVIVVEKTGRLADQIAKACRQKQSRFFKSTIDDPALAEIIADGDISMISFDDSPEAFRELLQRRLSKQGNPTLKLAWERFATYDFNAALKQSNFNKLQTAILLLGIAASALALTLTQFQQQLALYPSVWQALIFIIILLPISMSVLIAGANRFRSGNKWVLLRLSAENIKREIFCYRTKTKDYNGHIDKSPEIVLHSRVEAAGRRLMQTEVNLCALTPYCGLIPPKMYGAGALDDGYSALTSDQYLKVRLGDQLNYYQKKTASLERKLKRVQWSIYGFGGLGTFLAAVGLQLWIALTTTLVGVATLYLEYQQVENTLTKYNQAATDLANLRSWWTTLTEKEKNDPKNFEQLVEFTEDILSTEMAGWTQRMENALDKLRTAQAPQEQALENQK